MRSHHLINWTNGANYECHHAWFTVISSHKASTQKLTILHTFSSLQCSSQKTEFDTWIIITRRKNIKYYLCNFIWPNCSRTLMFIWLWVVMTQESPLVVTRCTRPHRGLIKALIHLSLIRYKILKNLKNFINNIRL